MGDLERLRFLFGDAAATVAGEFDLDDESERLQALDQYAALPDDAPARGVRMTIRAIVAAQILGDDPCEVWSTAQRLEASGLDSDAVLSQLTMVLGEHVTRTLDGDTFDTHAYTPHSDRYRGYDEDRLGILNLIPTLARICHSPEAVTSMFAGRESHKRSRPPVSVL